MKVICISKGNRDNETFIPVWPEVGSIYTFNRIIPTSSLMYQSSRKDIIWWELCEMLGYCYNSEIFAPLSDIDETELVNHKEEAHA